ncbi:18393_t:CDS:2 [Funneliformis geosporum]|nr:18393_t:CDS:2 [Funneliformis geosporum]
MSITRAIILKKQPLQYQKPKRTNFTNNTQATSFSSKTTDTKQDTTPIINTTTTNTSTKTDKLLLK